MRLKCGRTQAEKDARELHARAMLEARGQWHLFYPLWPRKVALGDCRFFELIERRLVAVQIGDYTYTNFWEYRLPDRMAPIERYMTAQPAHD